LASGQHSIETNALAYYSMAGKYSITLAAKDQYGCEKSVTKNDFVSVVKPVSAFTTVQTSSLCPPFTALFQNKSAGGMAQWLWDFGDGHTSTLSDPANVYINPGNFDVNLKVTDANGCTDQTSAPQLIH